MTPTTAPPPLASEALRILRFALKRRRRGKIAALPESTREQINRMLEDGVPYREIITRLGEAVRDINEDNLSRWWKTGFRDWQDARFRLQPLPPSSDAQQNQFAGDLRNLLLEFDPAAVAPILKRDPAKVAPLIKALARIAVACCEAEAHQSPPNLANPHQIADKIPAMAPPATVPGIA